MNDKFFEALGITPGPYFDAFETPPKRKYYGMTSCGSYSKDIFTMVKVWATNPEESHEGDNYEADKRMLLASPEMLEALIERAIEMETHQLKYCKEWHKKVSIIEKACYPKKWPEVKRIWEETQG